MDEQLTTQDEQENPAGVPLVGASTGEAGGAPEAAPATAPQAAQAEVEDRPWIPFGAELHENQQPDDRDQLAADLAAHDQRLATLADEDDDEALAEREATKRAANLAQSGIPEPFLRGQFVHRAADGSPIAMLVNFTCNRKNCLHASLSKAHAWMHAASHVARGQ